MSRWLDDRFAPAWAGGWALTRVLFGFAMIDAQCRRFRGIEDALAAPGVSLAAGPARVFEKVMLSPSWAWTLWVLGLAAAVGIVAGGRATKLWVLVFAACHVILLLGLGQDVRAPERVMIWATAGVLFGPIHERGLLEARRSPAARWYLMLVFSSLYGSTGMMKLVDEPAWWAGNALTYDLVDRFHAGGALAAALSGHPVLVMLMGWATLVIELSVPLLLWFRATSPLALLLGMSLHSSIELLMRVGPLGTTAVSLYPAVLHPDVGGRLWATACARWPRGTHRFARIVDGAP